MTAEEWFEELTAALAGTNWIAMFPKVSEDGCSCCADLINVGAREARSVRLPLERFVSTDMRRAEILRCIQTGRTTGNGGSDVAA
jgi:hypothetical protein